MATGFLQVMVTTQTAIPLENVKITVIDSASGKLLADKTVYTDSSGKSPLIELETVDRQYTLDRDNTTVLPYKNYDIVTEKEFYIRGENISVQIYDGQTTVQTVGLMPRPTDFGNEFERELNRGDVQKLFDIQPDLQEGTNNYILQRVVIPQSVTVHLGRPDARRQNVTVPFRTYVKSVAASEIYPTWPQQALRANIHCQISFVLNRIYTEWYRSRGYNFDITNSTSFDQKYIHNRATFESTDKIVDEIFNTYVTRQYNREPYFTEYCDGKQVTCRGLKQWGTVDLANQGMDALEIIRYYYGDDIQINETNNIANVNSSYPGTALRRGDTGENVRIIQAQLNRISDNYPAIGKMTVDGIFGPAMEERVKNFQRIFNLTADGVVGKSTWYKISYIYVAVKKLAELTSEGEAIQDGAYPGRPVRQGDRGLNVVIVQYYLSVASEYVPTVSQVALDGVFGSGTRTQVINFQRYYNLSPDGVVGPATWEKMYRLFLSVRDGVDNPTQTPPQSALYPGTPLRLGSTGANVSRVQNWLNNISRVYTQIPTLNVDGRYGPATQSAVIVFQQINRLSADGVVGRQTWNRLYSVWRDLVADGLI